MLDENATEIMRAVHNEFLPGNLLAEKMARGTLSTRVGTTLARNLIIPRHELSLQSTAFSDFSDLIFTLESTGNELLGHLGNLRSLNQSQALSRALSALGLESEALKKQVSSMDLSEVRRFSQHLDDFVQDCAGFAINSYTLLTEDLMCSSTSSIEGALIFTQQFLSEIGKKLGEVVAGWDLVKKEFKQPLTKQDAYQEFINLSALLVHSYPVIEGLGGLCGLAAENYFGDSFNGIREKCEDVRKRLLAVRAEMMERQVEIVAAQMRHIAGEVSALYNGCDSAIPHFLVRSAYEVVLFHDAGLGGRAFHGWELQKALCQNKEKLPRDAYEKLGSLLPLMYPRFDSSRALKNISTENFFYVTFCNALLESVREFVIQKIEKLGVLED